MLGKAMVKCLLATAILGMAVMAQAESYTVVDLTPAGFTDAQAFSIDIDGGQQVGYGTTIAGEQHALLWSGSAAGAVDLNPPGYSGGSSAYGVSGGQQVGRTGTTEGFPYLNCYAYMWSGTAASGANLTPAGFARSAAFGISGGQQVGYGSAVDSQGNTTYTHALLWKGNAGSAVDLNPSGTWGSIAHGISGDEQVGELILPAWGYEAVLWRGTAASAVDLAPAGFRLSAAEAVSGGHQVGEGVPTGSDNDGDFRALLWSGTPESVVNLQPEGYYTSGACAICGGKEVGWGRLGTPEAATHALLWRGTPESAVDLHTFLPAGFSSSRAQGIDAQGNIVGYATDTAGHDHAILWTLNVPEPSTLTLLAVGTLAMLAPAWRRRARTA